MTRSQTPESVASSLLRALTRRLFRASDTEARSHGWTVEARRGGLSRSYRDPRFDALAACPACTGAGQVDSQLCPRCAGTGRIELSQPAAPSGRSG